MKDLTIIIPAKNEHESLPVVLKSLIKFKCAITVSLKKDDLLKMNVLRKILSSMGTMDAIEFLLSKLKNTKNNADFFISMNKPS